MPSPVEITILTDTVTLGGHRPRAWLKSVARYCGLRPRDPSRYGHYGGHAAVTRSVVEGLGKIGAGFNYNPSRSASVGRAVVVLSGVGALRQAIEWKRQGRIERLLAGPNITVFPSDQKTLMCAPEVDTCLVPSEWVRTMYLQDCPELEGRCEVWATGVDTDYWTPGDKKPDSVLVYHKSGPATNASQAEAIAHEAGCMVRTLTYGGYRRHEFLRVLQGTQVMIAFSESESQGIALAEAWAVNVPTLVWDPGFLIYGGRRLTTSAAPYLTPETGVSFHDPAELRELLPALLQARTQFRPREWVLDHMSDEVSATSLCRLAGMSV